LRNRAIEYVERENTRVSSEMEAFTIADDLKDFALITPVMLLTLAQNGILTLDDLADLDTEELTGYLGEHGINSEEKAGAIIMEARKHWFDDEVTADDADAATEESESEAE
jgi:N utilization substance protein A